MSRMVTTTTAVSLRGGLPPSVTETWWSCVGAGLG